MSFRPDSEQLATSALDNTVRLWFFKNSQQVEPVVLDYPSKWAWGVAYNKEGDRVWAGGEDGNIHYWPTSMDNLANDLCDLVEKKLTKEELEKYTSAQIDYQTTNCVSFEEKVETSESSIEN